MWLGEECFLLSGARIGNGSILGARSLTSSTIGSNSLAVGVPAHVIKEDVMWSKDNDVENIETIYDCYDQDALKYYGQN